MKQQLVTLRPKTKKKMTRWPNRIWKERVWFKSYDQALAKQRKEKLKFWEKSAGKWRTNKEWDKMKRRLVSHTLKCDNAAAPDTRNQATTKNHQTNWPAKKIPEKQINPTICTRINKNIQNDMVARYAGHLAIFFFVVLSLFSTALFSCAFKPNRPRIKLKRE